MFARFMGSSIISLYFPGFLKERSSLIKLVKGENRGWGRGFRFVGELGICKRKDAAVALTESHHK